MEKVRFQEVDFLDADVGVFYSVISDSIFTLDNKDYSRYGDWNSDEIIDVPVYDFESKKGKSNRVAVQFSYGIIRLGDL